MPTNSFEQKFLDALRDIFVGAKVEGDSGYINLMKIKARYFSEDVFPRLMKDIDAACRPFERAFREELFDKLYDFFKAYFSESGSIYFRRTPGHQNVYDKVYTDDRDVILFWKTHMLYYVKTDRLFKSMEITVDEVVFAFNVSGMELKRANEKRELIYTFKAIWNGKLMLTVDYSERGRKTSTEEIVKAARANGLSLNEETLERACRVFEKQAEVDFFINKDAGGFLREQFDLWLFQYVFTGISGFTEVRLKQLQVIKEIAFKIIDFIAQFEDELVKIWNKPKFVRNSHYVITLDHLLGKGGPSTASTTSTASTSSATSAAAFDCFDKLSNQLRGRSLWEKVKAHAGMAAQVQEWRELGMIDEGFKLEMVTESDLTGVALYPQYRHLPLDTKHFADLELEILGLFDNLDEALDGWLVHSENYQALNTLLPKFKERVQTIYIDPPYNTAASEIIYENQYKHSSWVSLMNDRLILAKDILDSKCGFICCTIDDVEQKILGQLIENVFGEVVGTVSIRIKPSGRPIPNGFALSHEYAIFSRKNASFPISRLEHSEEQRGRYREEDEKGAFFWEMFRKAGSNSNRENRPTMYFPFYLSKVSGKIRLPDMDYDENKQTYIVKQKPANNEIQIYPIKDDGTDGCWYFGYERAKEVVEELRAELQPNSRYYLYYRRRPNLGVQPTTLWFESKYSATEHGTALLKNLFGEQEIFSYPKSIHAVVDCLKVMGASSTIEGVTLDFFAGSGTTAHAVMNLNREDGGLRKYILVEMGEHFNTVILPRVKKVAFSDAWKEGRAVSGGQGLSHFVKYFDLEQYEDTLRRARYADANLLAGMDDPYNSYVFLRDLKLLDGLGLDFENDRVEVHLEALYSGIDLAESLACVSGKWIKRITADEVEFEDGSKTSLKHPEWSLIKPLVWWRA